MHGDIVHILIVTYNATQWLPVCCRDANALPENWHITVVDNASTDETVDVIRREYPSVHLIRSPENLGFGRANNLGFHYALEQKAEYVYLLNQDSEIPLSGIAELIRLHKKCPECRIISPLHKNGTGSALDYSFARFCRKNGMELLADAGKDTLENFTPKTDDLIFTTWGIAAGWLLPRASLTEIGGFNPLFFHYGEDEDYVNRVLFHGGKIAIAPGVSMRHHRTESAKKKALDSRFVDRLIEMTNPAQTAPSPWLVIRNFAKPIFRQFTKGNRSLAFFLMRSCRELMRKELAGSPRSKALQKGPAFL